MVWNHNPMMVVLGMCLTVCGAAALRGAPTPPPGDPVRPTSLTLGAVSQGGAGAKLTGPDAVLQVQVDASFPDQRVRDWTSRVKLTAQPQGIIQVSEQGLVKPLADGTATLVAQSPEGLKDSVRITVERFNDPPTVDFVNQVVPIFTKLGCNGGGCHGKSGGQNGFSLSLLGFEPRRDYDYIVKESRGRRVFPTAPDSSLLLLKATNTISHGGGQKLDPDGLEYRILRRWITQGMPFESANPRVVTGIAAYPPKRLMDRDGLQQVRVIAKFADGSQEDVTALSQFEINDKELATSKEDGLVKMTGTPGDVAVMVRYQSKVGTFVATVPLGAPVQKLPPAKNFVDELVFAKLKELGLPPSDVADDSTFIRRVTLDISGRLPDPQRVRTFLADTSGDKRGRYIDELLASTDYADYFANKWSSVLRNKRVFPQDKPGTFAFHQWLRQSLHENKPYDRFVSQIVAASGRVGDNPPVAWYRTVNQMSEQVEDTSQLFLGIRIQCARCHHHPFEKWSQDDYYSLAAFFSRVGVKGAWNLVQSDEYRIFHRRGPATSQNPSTGKDLKPAGLGGSPLELQADQDPRLSLADWMVKPDNPYFARTLVNRYWKHFMGRGLVEPEDDLRETNPPVNPALLDALAQHFVRSGYDMKELVRVICSSSVYQLSSIPNQYNAADKQAFSRFYPRRLPAEALLDSIDAVNATATDLPDLPKGTRAVQVPDHTEYPVYFLQVFGRPAGGSACECERTSTASLAQSNSADVLGKISAGRAKDYAADTKTSDEQKVSEIYLAALSRTPMQEELKIALDHIAKAGPMQKQAAYEDILWALINTKEFLFNH